ncbi:hypothetical protein JK211_14475 [Tatumella sp. JGM130]|uniref:hypothetical protein n=1 Tax=Tatumella sp. JGM130 TaxID=2799797 RepID=UPI001BAF28A7|nr:hypothetical protein [Tatumella sp. JGM130]MBS0895220.1 hypothetical protein [Tatumella sp. JGM130]
MNDTKRNNKYLDQVLRDADAEFGTSLSNLTNQKKEKFDDDLEEFEKYCSSNEKITFTENFENSNNPEKKHKEENKKQENLKKQEEMMDSIPLPLKNDEEHNFKSVVNHFNMLDNDSFKAIFKNYEVLKDSIKVNLKSGAYVDLKSDKLSIVKNNNQIEKLPDVKAEVTALIFLSFEKNIKDFHIDGHSAYVEEALKQISIINEKLPDNEKFKVSCNKEHQHLYKNYFENKNKETNTEKKKEKLTIIKKEDLVKKNESDLIKTNKPKF